MTRSVSLEASTSARSRVDPALAFLLAFLPFCLVVRWPPNPGFWGQWLAVFVTLLWIALRLPSAQAVPRAALAFFALSSLLLLHSAAGLAAMPMATTAAAVTLLVAGVACIATHAIEDSETREACIRAFGWGLIAALVLNAMVVVLGWLGYEFHLYRIVAVPNVPRRALGLIGQSNHLGMLAVFATFAAWMLTQRGTLSRTGFWLVAIVGSVVCAATASRVAVVVWAVLLVFAWLTVRGPAGPAAPRRSARRTLTVLVLLFAAVQILWGASMAGESSGHTPEMTRSSAGRFEMLHDAVELWRRQPVFGIGNGNYAARRLHDLDGPLHAPHADNTHNLLAQALVEWGLIGAVIVLAGMAYAALLIWRNARDRDLSPETWFACAWLIGLLLHSQVEQPLWFMHFLLPSAVMLGVLKQPAIAMRSGTATATRGAMIGATLAVTALMVGVAWDYQRGQSLALDMLADLDRPQGVAPQVSFADVAKVEAFTLFPQYAKIMLSRKLPLGDAAAQAKLELARQAMDAVPNSETIARYCAFAVVAGHADSAQTLLEQLRRRSPPGYYQRVYALLDSWRATDSRLGDFVARLPQPTTVATVGTSGDR